MGIMDAFRGERIYLDTNIFIYALEAYPEYVSTLTSLFAAIDEGKIRAMTSELTLAEVLIKPMMIIALICRMSTRKHSGHQKYSLSCRSTVKF